MKNLLLLALLPLLPAAASAQPGESFFDKPRRVKSYVSAQGVPGRFVEQGPVSFQDLPQPLESQPAVFVDPSKTFQTLLGIGAALTDAAADTWATLSKEQRAEVVRAFYDPKEGLGYTVARTPIHSCDFSSMSYTYVHDGDKRLESFDIGHDLQNRVPLIRAAFEAAGGKLLFFASPWSPPAWMKDNGNMLRGGKLKPEFRQAWADYYVKFIRAYDKLGLRVWGVTVQNEPMATQKWESCLYTAEEERDFLRDYLGPTLAKAGLADRKILVWDHNRDLLYQRASVILDDPEAAKYAWGIAHHWYEDWTGGAMQWENARRTAEAYPDKPLFLSEAATCPFNAGFLDRWELGETYGRSMVHDFNNGAVAWTDWNMMLDERGGPNHVGNFCYAALHADTRTRALRYTSIYPFIGHFSKYIRPGAKRVAAVSSRDALLTTAFLNADGALAVVVMNASDQAVDYRLWIKGKAAAETSPARSITTLVVE